MLTSSSLLQLRQVGFPDESRDVTAAQPVTADVRSRLRGDGVRVSRQ